MSDTGRQSFTDKLGAAVKPDSEKTTSEHLGDKFKGNVDSLMSSAQPESEKSGSQKLGDMFSSNSNENGQSFMEKAKDKLGMGEKK